MFKNVKKPRWLCAVGASLQICLTTGEYTDIDYVINNGGSTKEERKIWSCALNGDYGPIADVPSLTPELEAYEHEKAIGEAKSKVIKIYEEGILSGLDNTEELRLARKEYVELLSGIKSD